MFTQLKTRRRAKNKLIILKLSEEWACLVKKNKKSFIVTHYYNALYLHAYVDFIIS